MNTEELQQIKDLYESGLNCVEISKKLNKNSKTVNANLHRLGVTMRPLGKINQEDFVKLWSEGKTDAEIAQYFNVSINTVKGFRTHGANKGKFVTKRWFAQEEHKLTEIQKQFIYGSLLGDLNISLTKYSKNAKVALVQSSKQRELFMKKIELLGEFMGAYKENSYLDKRTNKEYFTYRGNSKSHEEFTKIYNIVYKNRIKTITKEWLDKINHPIALAFWFMDDGSKVGTLATCCFSIEECKLLQDWLLTKWGIETSLQIHGNWPMIYIKMSSRFTFEKLIFPYIVPSMYYKLKYLEQIKACLLTQ